MLSIWCFFSLRYPKARETKQYASHLEIWAQTCGCGPTLIPLRTPRVLTRDFFPHKFRFNVFSLFDALLQKFRYRIVVVVLVGYDTRGPAVVGRG